jgi:hypothetical protein
MLSKTRVTLAFALAFPLLLLGSCGNEEAQDAQVRLVNATSEYATMDLYTINSKNEQTRFIGGTPSYGASGYSGLFEGSYTFQIVGAGGSSAASSTTGSVTKQNHFAVLSYLTGGTLTTVLVPEEESAPSSGNAKLRILNGAAQEVGGVDVYVTSHACNALTNIDTPFASGVTGLQTSFGQIITTSAGTSWNICVTGTGNKIDLRLAAPSVAFANQQVSTLILTHSAGGVLLNGMLLNQQGALTPFTNSLARVRLVADAAGNGTVSATVNNVVLATDQHSPQVYDYQPITSGPLTLALSIDGTAVTTTPLTTAAGADYTLLVAGTPGAPTIALLPDDNTPSSSIAVPVKMRLVNGMNNLGVPASLTAAGTPVGTAIPFGAASTYQSLASNDGTADVQVTAAGSTLFDLPDQTLSSGGVYTVFLLGDLTVQPLAGSTMRLDRTAIPVLPPASAASF